MQEQIVKQKLNEAITLYQKTKDKRALDAIEFFKNLLNNNISRKSLIAYAKYMYPGYKDPVHIQLITKNLELLEAGEIKRLAVFMPPRHGKSMLCSEFFPAWYLGNNPSNLCSRVS